jgi:Tol biopolymer transport system component
VERRPPSGTTGRARWLGVLLAALVLVPAVVAGAAVDETSMVSRTTAGDPADGPSGPGVVASADGRYVVFESTADNLSDADNDAFVNIFLRDREAGTTELVSRATGAVGAGADADSTSPAISPEGRYVAFESRATNLGDPDGDLDVFLRDLETDTTTVVSAGADGNSGDPSLSGGADFVAFESDANSLSDQDNDAVINVFRYDRTAGTTSLVSRPAVGTAAADGNSSDPSISSNGQRVAFSSDADNLFNDDRDVFTNVYVAEPRFRSLTHISRTATSGSEDHPANGRSIEPALSADGAHVAFVSTATNLAGGVGLPQVFLRGLSSRDTRLVSRGDGTLGAMAETTAGAPSISGDGRLVSFVTAAANLGEPGLLQNDESAIAGSDAFVRDMAWEDTILMSRQSGPGGAPLAADTHAAALAPGGSLLALVSGPDVLARELAWRDPPVAEPLPEGPGHGGHGEDGGHGGDGGHTDAGGHGADHGSAAGDGAGHGHGAGGAHFSLKLGGLAADRMLGTPLHDKLCGGAGNDVIVLGGGPDVGYGGPCGPVEPPTVTKASWWRDLRASWRHAGDKDAAPKTGPGANDNDRISGRGGDDALFGGPGSDRLVGGSGADFLSGGSGHDRLVGGPGRDRIEAGGGSDSINSADGRRELVDCGFGRDTVKADRRDVLSGCERVKIVRRKAKKDLPELLPECPGGGHACHEDGGTVVLSGARRGG